MNLEQLDELLIDWEKKIDLVSQNLLDLEGLLAYQRLIGVSGLPKPALKGISKEKISPALETINTLFEYLDLLLNFISRSKELRREIPRFFGSEEKVRALEQMLLGASVQLPTKRIPLELRGLLSKAEIESLISPQELLDIMTGSFKNARDVILTVEAAWDKLDLLLVNTGQKISTLESLAISLGQSELPDLQKVQQEINSLRERIEQDPLGVNEEYQQKIEPLIVKVQSELNQIVQQRQEIQSVLVQGHDYLKKLIEINQQVNNAFLESQEKVTDHSQLQSPIAPESIEALTQWLTRLENKFALGALTPVQIGLQNWKTKTLEYLGSAKQAYVKNQAPLQQRQELRGRLEALKAKAVAKGRNENEILTNLAEKAKKLLYTRPTPLAQAANLVQEYEKNLNS